MEISLKIVTELPLRKLWREDGFTTTLRLRDLTAEDLKSLLCSGPVQFVVVDVGHAPQWIRVRQCYDFWKDELQPHFAEPESAIYLNTFPGEYCYFVSEWSSPDGTPVVVCQRCH